MTTTSGPTTETPPTKITDLEQYRAKYMIKKVEDGIADIANTVDRLPDPELQMLMLATGPAAFLHHATMEEIRRREDAGL